MDDKIHTEHSFVLNFGHIVGCWGDLKNEGIGNKKVELRLRWGWGGCTYSRSGTPPLYVTPFFGGNTIARQ